MLLNYCPTIGGRLFYLGDDGDENAPVLSMRFGAEFDHLPNKFKQKLTRELLESAIKQIKDYELSHGTEPTSAGVITPKA